MKCAVASLGIKVVKYLGKHPDRGITLFGTFVAGVKYSCVCFSMAVCITFVRRVYCMYLSTRYSSMVISIKDTRSHDATTSPPFPLPQQIHHHFHAASECNWTPKSHNMHKTADWLCPCCCRHSKAFERRCDYQYDKRR